MDKLTIEVPEGEYCKGCLVDESSNLIMCVKFKENRKHRMGHHGEWVMLKCPACISAIKAYKDTHDYETARIEKIKKASFNRGYELGRYYEEDGD